MASPGGERTLPICLGCHAHDLNGFVLLNDATGIFLFHCLDAEAEDAARRGDIAGLKEAVRRIGIDAPGVDRKCLAVGADVECDVVERVRREEIDRLSSRVRIRIALAVYALQAGKI